MPSRAYIAFKNEGLVATFSREYDGHVFRDKAGGCVLRRRVVVSCCTLPAASLGLCPFHSIPSTCLGLTDRHPGNESHAIVEYAPFQKVPSEKKKTDARNNTIDKGE